MAPNVQVLSQPLRPATQDEQNSLNLTPEHEEFLIEEA